MSDKQVRDYDKFMLRLPEGMRDSIAERAKENGRSMNSEIVQIIEDALIADKVAKNRHEIRLLKQEIQALDFDIGMRASQGENVDEGLEELFKLTARLDDLTGGKPGPINDVRDPDIPPIADIEHRLANIEGILMELFKDKLKPNRP